MEIELIFHWQTQLVAMDTSDGMSSLVMFCALLVRNNLQGTSPQMNLLLPGKDLSTKVASCHPGYGAACLFWDLTFQYKPGGRGGVEAIVP